MDEDRNGVFGGEAARFATTCWSAVLAAGRESSPQSDKALEDLCRIYWHPLYAFVRRQGCDVQDAQDLTQEFFARLLAKHYLGQVDRRKGRFRSFLLAAIKHFIANEWDRSMAAKRGGGSIHIFMDDPNAEATYSLETASHLTADKLLDRRWAFVVLGRAMARLRGDFIKAGKAPLFDRLKLFLTGEKGEPSYAALASELGLSETAIKVTVHRMRQRCRELVRQEIAQTVSSPDEIDDELAHLMAALKG